MVNDRIEGFEGNSLLDFVQNKKLNLSGVAILVNGEIAVKEQYESILLHDGSKLEIIRFVGGG
jgi:thiamine biosynthesis protein ThiS